jgi:hypothetical protein
MMVRLLRRIQPFSTSLAVLYWIVVLVLVASALLALFTLADRFLPGAGQL